MDGPSAVGTAAMDKETYKYCTLRERPELKNTATEWFHSKWGVPENDFHDRKDLTPNVCAVYTEEKYRCRGIAGRLLHMVVDDMKSKKITPVYLVTDHIGFYERYGWDIRIFLRFFKK